ncbi:hypothetical protein ACFV7Q_16765 [Streptomyces sp. NPDC059851]|uniref:hypothetical protein n=1 Tax=Streptomyces sp. NPDC059851 TaxID=3346971 RepID=UPI00365C81F2
MRRTVRFHRAVTALTLSTALLAGATGCSSGDSSGARAQGANAPLSAAVHVEQIEAVELQAALAQMRAEVASLEAASVEAVPLIVAEPTPTTSAERQKFAKTRFVVNAGLAAGATYQWIVKPYRAGKFKKGAKGRTFALIKAGLAGAFAYNRLKAAVNNAKGDPLLSKALVPLTAGIESLKGLATKVRSGQAGDAEISSFEDVINGVKGAGKSAGAPVTDQVPSPSQLGG